MFGLTSVLARLYQSEINCSISSFWDVGWTVALGDDMNGWKADTLIYPDHPKGRGPTVAELEHAEMRIARWLDEAVREHWPESDYAKRIVCAHMTVLKTASVGMTLTHDPSVARCFETAEYVIYGRTGRPEDITHACKEHVGDLLGDPGGLRLLVNDWRVMPICGVCGNESPEERPDPHCRGCSPWSPDPHDHSNALAELPAHGQGVG